MNLTKYRSLPPKIKAIATKYFLAVILERLALDNLNQLSKKIREKNGPDSIRNCSYSFLRKKWNNEPIDSAVKIHLLDELVPGARKCLTHPLWQLFAGKKMDQTFINDMLYLLDGRVSAPLFSPSTDMAHPTREKFLTSGNLTSISRHNNPDALACLLLLSLEQRNSKLAIETSAYRTFIRLISFTPMYQIKEELYALIYFHIFPKGSSDNNELRSCEYALSIDMYNLKHVSFKSHFTGIEKDYLDKITHFYRSITNDAISLNLIENNTNQGMLFCNLFDNTDRGWVFNGIRYFKKGGSKDHSSGCLPKLLRQMKYNTRCQ
jgi:hypothetical protein